MAVNGQKLLPQGNRGGALAVSRPKVSLVKKEVKKDITSAPDTMLVIKTRVVEIEKILKGSVALDKKIQDQERKEKQKLLRAEEEKELETKDDDDADKKVKKKKSKIKLGFLDGLIKFINDVLMGWLLVRMVDFLPQLKKILPLLGGALDFLTSTVLGIVNALGTFLMWGDKVISGSRKFVENIFGEKGAKVFDAIVGTIGNLFNLIAILGMTAGAFGNEWGRQSDKPRGKPRKKPKWQKKLQQKWKKSRLGKRVRNFKAGWKKTTRRISQALKPKNIANTLKNTGIGKRVTQTTKKISEAIKNPRETLKKLQKTKLGQQVTKTTKTITDAVKDPKKALKNLQKTEIGKKVTNFAKKVDPRKWKMPQIKTPGWMKKAGGLIKQGFSNADAWIKSIPAKRKALFDTIGKSLTEFKTSQSAKWGARLKKLKNLKPQAAIDKLTAKIRPHIDDILNKNPVIKKLVSGLKPANAKGAIRGLLTKAANNPLLKKLINTLKSNKGATKGMGPVDKIIAALMALWQYTKGGESPINAIVQGLSGLLGWSAGFSAATAVPVLGQSGVFNFMGGMAGAWAGDKIGKVILKGLANTGLANIEDPIMGGEDIKKGLPARKLVRDPDSIIGDTQKQDPIVGGEGEEKTKPEKMDKTFKIGKKTFDLSKLQGGLTDEEYNALSDKDRRQLNRRLRSYASQNEGVAKIMPIDVNSVAKNTEAISKSASYEEGGEGGTVVIVENSSGGGDQQTESGSTVVAGGGSDDSTTDSFYKGG